MSGPLVHEKAPVLADRGELSETRNNTANHAKIIGDASGLRWLRCTVCRALTSRESAEATSTGLHLCAGCGAPAVPADIQAELAERRRLAVQS